MTQLISNEQQRVAVVLSPSVEYGSAANLAAIVVGGLKCAAFIAPIADQDNNYHVSIYWNVVILKAKTGGQVKKVLLEAKLKGLEVVIFTEEGRALSNSYPIYKELVENHKTEELNVLVVGLFGDDDVVRELTKSLSVFK